MQRRTLPHALAGLAIVLATATVTFSAATPVAAASGDIRINEVESNGDTTDWVEFTNIGASSVDISGWVFSDNSASTYTIPAGVSIAPGAFFVIDDSQFGFGLGGGDTAELFEANGTTVVDTYTWPPGHATITWGRCPDGTGAFAQTTASTRGAANVCDPTPPTTTNPSPTPPGALDIKVNEIESDGGSPGDWIELYNSGGSTVDVSNFVLMDDQTRNYRVPAGTSLTPGGFFAADVDPVFGLGNGDQARLFAPDATTLIDSYTYPGHATITWARCPDGAGAFAQSSASTKGAANNCAPTPPTTTAPGSTEPGPAGAVVITEVAPWGSGNSTYAADWFELTNISASPVNISGWKVDDSSAALATALPLTGVATLAPGESAIFLESNDPTGIAAAFLASWFPGGAPAGLQIGVYNGGGVGLSTGGDGVAIFDGSGALYTSVSFGQSPAAAPFASFDNAAGATGAITTLSVAGVNGAFLSSTGTPAVGSPGAIEGGDGPTPTIPTTPPTTAPAGAPWPGEGALTPVDLETLAIENLSGLTYEGSGSAAPGTLWAVLNNVGTLYKLTQSGPNWVPAETKTLKYPDGLGNVDAEGVTMAGFTSANGLFVASERNNEASGVSRNAILRFDPTTAGSTISATNIWDITADLPTNGANLGLEAITWVPDSFLVANGFVDESAGGAYDPSDYANHGNGLFFVGVEGTGNIHVYALDLSGAAFHRVASFSSGFPGVMALEFDPDTGDFWAHCDNGCDNRSNVLRISATGAYVVSTTFAAPSGMPTNMNTEGFAITPNTECVNNLKPVFWSDDGDTGGFSLRRGSISCAPTPTPEIPEFPMAALPALMAGAVLIGAVTLARRRRPAVI